uniref:Secreted protein n=1 Tax=Xiphophorus maculatus TaxID=8083 RepID=A0A3B5QR51_XIPMA
MMMMSLLVCFRACVCVCRFWVISLPPSLSTSRSLGMQRMPPRLSWSQCPSSSYSLSHTPPHTHTPARPQMQTHTVFISIFTRTFTDFHSFFIHFHNLTRTLKLHGI